MADYTIRRATAADADELIRLRRVMFDALGVSSDQPTWPAAFARLIETGTSDGTVGAFVADIGGPELAGGGVGQIWSGPPGPTNPTGRRGHIYSMATNPEWRGRGIATAIVVALLDWFVGSGVSDVDLHASRQGEPIYRALGFTDRRFPELVWRTTTDRPSPPAG